MRNNMCTCRAGGRDPCQFISLSRDYVCISRPHTRRGRLCSLQLVLGPLGVSEKSYYVLRLRTGRWANATAFLGGSFRSAEVGDISGQAQRIMALALRHEYLNGTLDY